MTPLVGVLATDDRLSGAEVVAGISLALGIALIVTGAYLGLQITPRRPVEVDRARASLDDAQARLQESRQQLESIQAGGLEAAGDVGGRLHDAAAAAESSAGAASSALEQVSGIVAALPENLRFAGLLVLVGTVLVSVATIQFGGTSLF